MEHSLGRAFGSDNFSPVHQRVLDALIAANIGHAQAYGSDVFTQRAEAMFRTLFGEESSVYFVFNGTAANVLAMRGFLEPFSAVLCASTAHIHLDECGAPEQILGCKLITVPSRQGKVCLKDLEPWLLWQGNVHHAQPRLISVAQSTELGTVYSIQELRELASFAHAHEMFLHVDGARLANAMAHLNCSVKELLVDTGVDVISFGGTKNGMMFGEAVVFPNPNFGRQFCFLRKNMAQLYSKMRYISAQFCAMLEDDFWIENARKANNMANILGAELASIPGVELAAPVQTNGVFVKIPKHCVETLQKECFFYIWDEANSVARFMVSFDVEEDDVRRFVAKARAIIS